MRTESDKIESGYWDRYCEILPNEIESLLELGVDEGLSLALWNERYPNAHIYGVDNRECPLLPGGTRFVLADQTDRTALEEISRQADGWDVVVDDASHYGAQSVTSFTILWPFIRPGGFYVVEDWMTGYWSWWPDFDGGYTMVDFVKGLVDYLSNPNSDVASVAFYPGQVFIQKKRA